MVTHVVLEITMGGICQTMDIDTTYILEVYGKEIFKLWEINTSDTTYEFTSFYGNNSHNISVIPHCKSINFLQHKLIKYPLYNVNQPSQALKITSMQFK